MNDQHQIDFSQNEFDATELVAGTFKSIRKFVPKVVKTAMPRNLIWNWCDDIITTETPYEIVETTTFGSLGYHMDKRYEIGKEYVAECNTKKIYAADLANYLGRPITTVLTTEIRREGMVICRIVNETFKEENIFLPFDKYQDIIREHPEPAPFRDCLCGFYSFHTWKNLEFDRSYASFAIRPTITAVVENSGRVIHGKVGLRAEKMKILGVATTGHEISNLLDEFPLDTL